MAPPVLFDDETISLNLEMGTTEDIYGFGEQFGRLVKNGQRLVLRTEDALGTGTGRAYKPSPVWHSSAGYMALLNSGAEIVADIGHSRPSVLSIISADDCLDLILIVAEHPADRLAEYTRLTGRAQVPPLWAFGYWMGRCRYHSSAEMLDVADTMRAHEIPADVLHVDPDWLVLDRLNTDFIWNQERFGSVDQFCEDLHTRGFQLSVWEVPYIDRRSPLHSEAAARGFLVTHADGSLAELEGTPTPEGLPRSLVDFTNPEAVIWWQDLHREFVEAGVAVFKTDFGEGCPNGVATADGTPPGYTHNLFPLRYNKTVSNGLRRLQGRNPLVWGRSGWAGSHRYPGQWGGDAESTVVGMQATLRGGLSHALSAPGLWSHDIGGFYGPELTEGLYVRWTQFGALSPLMRAHGLRPREPWAFGERALGICRDWIRLRYSLLPYLWQTAQECGTKGLPMMRPLALAFPNDANAAGLDGQYLLGPDLLVAPVFDDQIESVEHKFYLPEGTWHDFITGDVLEGPGHVVQELPLERMPVLVRDGAVIPTIEVDATVRNAEDAASRPWLMREFGTVSNKARFVGFDGKPYEG
ncbi:MAG: glycoside hydrolase family 31 protein [Propionibacteriaceae bacterium]|nr:glycoside hydrolase family 31 protein [Propionibacteriaceae bacterium]